MVSSEKGSTSQEIRALVLPPARPSSDGCNHKKWGSAHGLRRRPQAVLALLAWFILLIFPSDLVAVQERCYPPECKEVMTFSWNVMPLYMFPSKLEGGGTLSLFSLIFGADVSKQVNEKLGASVRFNYIYDSYNFSGLDGFWVPHPWSSIHTVGVEVSLIYAVTDTWKVILVPGGQFSGEDGARFDGALAYGGAVALSHIFGPKLELGLGIAAYYNLEEVSVYPYFTGKYKVSDRIQVSNPFPPGPAGPTGVEIIYKLNKHWGVGVGAAYRSPRFRLKKSGPIPDGIGEYRNVPVFARLSYEHSPALRIDLYGGASFLNKVYIENSKGDELFKTNQYVAPLMGLMISGTL